MPQFINDNLVWLIIIAVVFVLAIIGYVAEKHGFGTNTKKNDKPEPKEENIQPIVEDKETNENIEITDETPAEVPVEEPAENNELSFENSLEFDTPEDNPSEVAEELTEEAPIDISDQLEEPVIEENNETIEEPEIEELSFEDEPAVESPEEVTEEPKSEELFDFTEEPAIETEPVEENKEESDTIDFTDVPTEEPTVETSTETPKVDEDLYAPFGDQEFSKDNSLNIDQDFNKVLDDVNEVADTVDTSNVEKTVNEAEDEDIWKF